MKSNVRVPRLDKIKPCRLIFVALIFFIGFAFGSAQAGQTDFALTFNCGDDYQRLCLIGQIASGKSVALLSSKSSRICRARTADSFMYFFEPGNNDILSTHIKLGHCQDPGQYFLAYLGAGQVKYQLFELSLFEEKSIVRDFEGMVRKEKLLEYDVSLLASPRVFSLPVSRKKILIGQYEAEGQAGYGPLFMSARGKAQKIHFLASVYRVFRLNGRLYLLFHWKDTQEGSGDQGSALVELTESGFKLIFEDASWST